jgi:thymidylate synthase (FAD)
MNSKPQEHWWRKEMHVKFIAGTRFMSQAATEETDGIWEPEDPWDDSSSLSEFAGRQCYESFKKPNPDTATNKGYIKNIIDQGHTSVLEHGSASFRISGVSRSYTHELVRHRHFSYSQVSQRYVQAKAEGFIIPPLYADEWELDPDQPKPETQAILERQWKLALEAYDALVAIWMPRILQVGFAGHQARKKAREAARCVLPNMTPTAIVMTGNHLAWRQMLEKRGSLHADAEMREVAVQIFDILNELEPSLYQDFVKQVSPEGMISLTRGEA